MIITKLKPFTKEEIEKLKQDQKIIIGSLAMDLKRVALGLHRGSFNMADRFAEDILMYSTLFQNFALKKM